MKPDRRQSIGLFCACLALALAHSGCTSVITRAPDGRPRLFGIGSVRELAAVEGRVFQVSAPGASLRLGPGWGGWTVGLQETLVFLAVDAAGRTEPDAVAVLTRAYGIDFGAGSISVGFDRRFTIFYPRQASVIQMISYSEGQPEITRIRRKEVR